MSDPVAQRAALVTRTTNAINAIDAASAQMDVAITALTGAPGRWDAATPTQRDNMMLNVATDLKSLMANVKRTMQEYLDNPVP